MGGLDSLVAGHLLENQQAVVGALVEGVEPGHALQRLQRLGVTPRLKVQQPQLDPRGGPGRLPADRFGEHLGRHLVLAVHRQMPADDEVGHRASG